MQRVGALLVHANGAKHAVVEQHDDAFGTVLHGSGELLAVHQKVAVTGDRERHASSGDSCRNASRYAITHGTDGGCDLGFVSLCQAVVFEESVHPARKVAGTVGQHGIGRQVFLQQEYDGRHVNASR